MSLNPVIPHLKMVVSITIGHNRKSILSDPIRNDFESQVFPCFWSNGSNSLHSLHIIAMPSDALMKSTLPSITNTIWWPSFLFLFITMMMYVTAALRGWSFLFVYCITNYCCFIIVVLPTVYLFPLQGLYMVNIVVRLLCSLRLLWRPIVPFLKDLVLL